MDGLDRIAWYHKLWLYPVLGVFAGVVTIKRKLFPTEFETRCSWTEGGGCKERQVADCWGYCKKHYLITKEELRKGPAE